MSLKDELDYMHGEDIENFQLEMALLYYLELPITDYVNLENYTETYETLLWQEAEKRSNEFLDCIMVMKENIVNYIKIEVEKIYNNDYSEEFNAVERLEVMQILNEIIAEIDTYGVGLVYVCLMCP